MPPLSQSQQQPSPQPSFVHGQLPIQTKSADIFTPHALNILRMFDGSVSGAEFKSEEARDCIQVLETTIRELAAGVKELGLVLARQVQAQNPPEIKSTLAFLEGKVQALVTRMKENALKEKQTKELISEFHLAKETAKTTVSAAAKLDMSRKQQKQEHHNLKRARAEHKAAVHKYDRLVRHRKMDHKKLLDLHCIMAELNKREVSRNYDLIFMTSKALGSNFFTLEQQRQFVRLVQKLAVAQKRAGKVYSKRCKLKQARTMLDKRIALLVTQYWV